MEHTDRVRSSPDCAYMPSPASLVKEFAPKRQFSGDGRAYEPEATMIANQLRLMKHSTPSVLQTHAEVELTSYLPSPGDLVKQSASTTGGFEAGSSIRMKLPHERRSGSD